jgi:hypothetical protein
MCDTRRSVLTRNEGNGRVSPAMNIAKECDGRLTSCRMTVKEILAAPHCTPLHETEAISLQPAPLRENNYKTRTILLNDSHGTDRSLLLL